MNVNWDEVAQEADDSPRSLLAEVLGRVDEVDQLIIITVDSDGRIHRWTYGSDQQLLSMLDMAHFYICQSVAGED